MKSVTVGGLPWTHFDAAAETIDFAAAELTTAMLPRMREIRATFE